MCDWTGPVLHWEIFKVTEAREQSIPGRMNVFQRARKKHHRKKKAHAQPVACANEVKKRNLCFWGTVWNYQSQNVCCYQSWKLHNPYIRYTLSSSNLPERTCRRFTVLPNTPLTNFTHHIKTEQPSALWFWQHATKHWELRPCHTGIMSYCWPVSQKHKRMQMVAKPKLV